MSGDPSELVAHVLRPLLLGGEVRPVRPLGSRRAAALASRAHGVFVLDEDLAQARLREARRLWPIDQLSPLTRAEWLLLAALNDLLQVNNPDLRSSFDRDRPQRLLEMARTCITAAGSPKAVADALARHATFARVAALQRTDTLVRWWSGQRWFIGAKAPRRLLAWQRLRRVQQSSRHVPLWHMAGESAWASRYADVVEAWLAATPLTELALGRLSAAALGLAQNPLGRSLVGRAAERAGTVDRIVRAARAAATERDLRDFIGDLEQRAARAV